MSVAVTRTWRDAQAQREGKKVPRRWLVTVIVEHRDGTRERDRTVVGEGTPHSVGTEVQAKKWGERREKELYDRGPRIEREAAAKADEPEPEKESCSKWWGDYHDAAAKGEVGRKSQGRPQAAIDDRRAIFKNWIAPAIGDMPMSDGEEMTRALRKLVRKLDDAVRVRQSFYRGEISRTPVVGQRDGKAAKPQTSGAKPGISGKTARHIWGEVTNGFKEARSSKLDELRILKGDPTVGVQPPICPDDDRDQAALYPSEIVTLLSCEAIPLSRRRVYAVAIYTGMRLSELTRFEASHVDFEHDVISVMGKKTNAATRQVPIDKALRPLLKVLAKEAPTGPSSSEERRQERFELAHEGRPRTGGPEAAGPLARRRRVHAVHLPRNEAHRDHALGRRRAAALLAPLGGRSHGSEDDPALPRLSGGHPLDGQVWDAAPSPAPGRSRRREGRPPSVGSVRLGRAEDGLVQVQELLEELLPVRVRRVGRDLKDLVLKLVDRQRVEVLLGEPKLLARPQELLVLQRRRDRDALHAHGPGCTAFSTRGGAPWFMPFGGHEGGTGELASAHLGHRPLTSHGPRRPGKPSRS